MRLTSTRLAPAARVGPAGPPTRRRFRVLTIAPTYFFADSGCHVRILEEARTLQALGSEVVICAYRGGREVAGVTTSHPLPIPGQHRVRIGSSRSKPVFDALLFLHALGVGLRYRPHLIHAHLHEGALIGYLLSRLYRVPLVFDFQGSLTSEMVDHNFLRPQSSLYRPLHWLEGVLDRRSDVVVTSTHHSAELLVSRFGCDPGRVVALPDAVNTDVFAPRWSVDEAAKATLRRQLGLPEGRKLVVYLGLLAEYQGTGALLYAAKEVLRRCPAVHFLLMGYPGQDRYRGLARALGIGEHVTFTGQLPYERAPLHLALGDVAAAPKVSATEGNGKLLNYMAVGLPTVAFDTPVNREFLGDLGEYAPLGDSDGLARGLLRFLTNPAEAAERGRRLRDRAVRRFPWSQAGERLLDIYEWLVE